MIGLLLLAVVVVLFLRWRFGHRRRRRVELASGMAARQPFTEWSARMPSDRRHSRKRMRGKRWGF